MTSLPVAYSCRARAGTRAAATIAVVLSCALVATPAAAFNETGGSGLLQVEQAYSLPIGRPLISFYGGYYSHNFQPGTARPLVVTPSATVGLGAGFDASAALPFEGLTSPLYGGEYTRRFDIRRAGLQTKLRWTADLGSPRLRGGVLGGLTLPLGAADRPGATRSPDTDRDTGIMALLSGNVGWFSVPVRVHLNAGYWWSRNDGAFIYQDLPTAIPVTGIAADRNDVFSYGIGVEAGLRRAVVFVELMTEQFIDARSALTARENLWRLTPGFRTQLSSTVGLTGAVAFDISSDDAATAFDPSVSYPDYELKLGVTLGSVLSRERHEEARRDRDRNRAESPGPLAAPAPAGIWPTAIAPEPTPAPAPALAVVPAAAVAVVAMDADATRIRELEDRLARVETAQRLAYLEARLAILEGRPAPEAAPVAPATPMTPAAAMIAPAAVAPAAADTVNNVTTLPAPQALAPSTELPVVPAATDMSPQMQARLDALQQELHALKEQRAMPSPEAIAQADTAAVPPAAATAVPAPAVSPEVRAQLDAMQDTLQKLVADQAARGRPVAVTAAEPVRSTVIVGDPGAANPPVLSVQAPAAPPATAAAQVGDGTGAPVPATSPVALDPALLQPYAPAPAEPRPAAAASAPAVTPPAAVEPPLGLAVGQRRTLAGIDVTAAAPLAAAAATRELDGLAAGLNAEPTARIALLVHGGGADRAAALAGTDDLAALIRDYLVAAGAPAAGVVPVGMGLAEGGAPRVEIERIR